MYQDPWSALKNFSVPSVIVTEIDYRRAVIVRRFLLKDLRHDRVPAAATSLKQNAKSAEHNAKSAEHNVKSAEHNVKSVEHNVKSVEQESRIVATVQRSAQILEQIKELDEKLEMFRAAQEGCLNLPDIQQLLKLPTFLPYLRIQARISQKELARRLGVSKSQLSRWESRAYADVPIKRIQQVLKALDQ